MVVKDIGRHSSDYCEGLDERSIFTIADLGLCIRKQGYIEKNEAPLTYGFLSIVIVILWLII